MLGFLSINFPPSCVRFLPHSSGLAVGSSFSIRALLHLFYAGGAVPFRWEERLASGAKSIKFTPNMQAVFRGKSGGMGDYPVLFDPREARKTLIMGMFVLRPANCAWNGPSLSQNNARFDQDLYCVEDWAYGYKGIDGGLLIADNCPFDAFRVALQYGLSDAVIVGTKTVCAEGIDNASRKGYLWQPYYMTQLDELKAACPNALELISEQRLELQREGYLSLRRYPAVIIFSHSGDCQGATDFLNASIFNAFHPNGEPAECYIMTSELGAASIRKRINASFPHLVGRIKSMLIIIPHNICSKSKIETDIDIGSVPQLLFDRFGICIANHDGGHGVLRDFCRAGAVAQVNLTLCRNRSLKEIIFKSQSKDTGNQHFEGQVQLFFSSATTSSPSQGQGRPRGTIPREWRAVYCVEDGEKKVAVVSFDTRTSTDFCQN